MRYAVASMAMIDMANSGEAIADGTATVVEHEGGSHRLCHRARVPRPCRG